MQVAQNATRKYLVLNINLCLGIESTFYLQADSHLVYLYVVACGVARLLRTRRAHAKYVLGTKSVDLFYQFPSLNLYGISSQFHLPAVLLS